MSEPPDSPASRGGRIVRWAEGLVVAGLTCWYFGGVFRMSNGRLPEDGLSAWLDPYFINAMLENWRHSLLTLSDPASPPMYFPVPGTLGYSVGLILFAPLYIVARCALEPFQAHTATIFAVMVGGSWCLYLILRRHLGLSAVEAFVLSAFFASSGNVVSAHTNSWSQMASIFLLPMLLLLALAAWRVRPGSAPLSLAAFVGLLAALLFVQDFYTGQFALLVSVAFLAALLAVRGRVVMDGVRRRPRQVAAFALGVSAGVVVFLWVYLGAFLEHRTFPEHQLIAALFPVDTSQWTSLSEAVSHLVVYQSGRSFAFVAGLTLVVWLPWCRADRPARWLSCWLAGLSIFVVLAALRFGEFSLWKTFAAPLPGLSVLRDPKRIIYTYELAVVLVTGVILARYRRGAPLRLAVTGLLAVLLVSHWNRYVFEFERSAGAYRQWVQAPIVVNAACRSFFIKGASETYMARAGHMWSLYGVDATFVALRYSIPTLNGYSAWSPTGWGLANPQERGYLDRVDEWIAAHRLRGVCALDIDARRMQPYRSGER